MSYRYHHLGKLTINIVNADVDTRCYVERDRRADSDDVSEELRH